MCICRRLSLCPLVSVAGRQTLMQIRSRERFVFSGLDYTSLSFPPTANSSSLFQAPNPLPSTSWFVSLSVFIAYDDYTSLSLPYLFITMEPTPNYTHQRWGVEEGEGRRWGHRQVWLQFQTPLDFLLFGKRA